MTTRSATSNARRTLLRRGRDLLRPVSKGRGKAKGDVMDLLNPDQRAELGLIHLALERIERGIFGTCDQCSQRISEERLLAEPWKPECAVCEAATPSAQPEAEVGSSNLLL